MLRFSFVGSKEVDCHMFSEQVKKLYEDMATVTSGKASEEEILEYCTFALKTAMHVNKDMSMWCCADTIHGMPSDVRVAFLYEPTYIISGIIMYSLVNYKVVQECTPIIDSLPRYLNGCLGRNFQGHGYEAEEGFNTAMTIFDKCNVKEFVEKYPEINPTFTNVYLAANEYWQRRWKESHTKS